MEARSVLRGETRPLETEELLIHRVLDRALNDNGELGERVALVQCDGTRITYNQLNRKANRLAARLADIVNKKQGDVDNKVVAICLHPSIEMIVSILAIFKTGSAYLPLDPLFPADRVTHILEDSKPALLLSSGSVLQGTSFASVVENKVTFFDLDEVGADEELEAPPPGQDNPSDGKTLAVVLYTSGSTGIPKGVKLEHRTILHRLSWQWRTFPYADDEVGCCKTALTFVDSIAEIWAPLLIGVPIHIVPKQVTQDTQRFIDLLDRCRITRLVLVPSLLKAMLTLLKDRNKCYREGGQPPLLERLRTWVCSGEILTSQLLLEFYDVFPEGTVMCNYYGSTEVMGDVTYATFTSRQDVMDAVIDNKVPIGTIPLPMVFSLFHSNCMRCYAGKPLDNCLLYLLGLHNEVVEEGDIGEIYVAGSHLCSGYVNNREMDRFVPNHIDPQPGRMILRIAFFCERAIDFIWHWLQDMRLCSARVTTVDWQPTDCFTLKGVQIRKLKFEAIESI